MSAMERMHIRLHICILFRWLAAEVLAVRCCCVCKLISFAREVNSREPSVWCVYLVLRVRFDVVGQSVLEVEFVNNILILIDDCLSVL